MSYRYKIQYETRELIGRIRYMTEKELGALYEEILEDIRGNSYLSRYHMRECDDIMEEVARVRREKKQDELREAMILFFRSNAHLGVSLRSVADRIVDAIETQGGAMTAVTRRTDGGV